MRSAGIHSSEYVSRYWLDRVSCRIFLRNSSSEFRPYEAHNVSPIKRHFLHVEQGYIQYTVPGSYSSKQSSLELQPGLCHDFHWLIICPLKVGLTRAKRLLPHEPRGSHESKQCWREGANGTSECAKIA